ncbi:Snf7 family protein [Hyperthermus butylicus]|uniref:Conserved crenarchaeal protein n=1 Tax=Hyperthermus butylicus (strain DSM 5456 / JCM 9403 / PLM1-5) TaxID=415426 RepID=A2BKY9_HYPBU|nr:hypothetical protein [Hyperthermus butylicus]ABM80650.1 conserved crenarchaeal protein [Hyperthermus butylicus DSM 5456]
MSAIISRLLGFLGVGEHKQPSLKERIDHAIVKLELLEDRVAELRYRFEKRSRELFEKVVVLLRRGEKSRAAIYAGEVSQVRNILKMVVTVENLIIMTKERLKTVRDVRELGQTLMVFGAALEEVKDQITSIYPNLNLAFEEITRTVKNMIVETSMDIVGEVDPAIISHDALKVLDEAMRMAEERIKSEFPEPPVEPIIHLETRKQPKKTPVPVAVPAAPSSTRSVMPQVAIARREQQNLEELVLNYIREHNGYLDLKDFTTRYGVARDEVLRALYKLAEKGLIKLS